MADHVLVITGPTASGKSVVALAAAQALDGEIVSMDSRQVYRGMDIGTAKPDGRARALVPHHGLDLVDPDERYSAGRFAREAREWIAGIRERGRVPILVGGTGFFLRALLEPLFPEPPLDPARRERLKEWLARQQATGLRHWVEVLDPAGAVAARDPQRLARRLEVALLTGRTLGWWHAQPGGTPPVRALVVVLDLPRAELYARIDARVQVMIAAGLPAEVGGLLEQGYGPGDPGMNAVGYIELVPYLRGERSLEEATALIQNATRAYARRQLTWFRRQLPADSLRLPASADTGALAGQIIAEWGRVGS